MRTLAQMTAPTPAPGGTSKLWLDRLLEDPAGSVRAWINAIINYAPETLLALVLLIVAWMLAAWLRRTIIRAAARTHADITLGKFLGNMSRWAVLIFAGITCLGTFGVNVTSFATIIGAAGLAIGLALQGNLSNLASGVMILIFRPFKVGDSVIVAGQSGVVDGIDLFTTNLDTPDHRRLIVPNNAILTGVIENRSHHPVRRVEVTVPIGSPDMDRTRGLLLEAARRVLEQGGGVVTTPAPGADLAEIAPAQMWTVTLWCRTGAYAEVRQALLIELKRTIDREQLAPGAPVSEVRLSRKT